MLNIPILRSLGQCRATCRSRVAMDSLNGWLSAPPEYRRANFTCSKMYLRRTYYTGPDVSLDAVRVELQEIGGKGNVQLDKDESTGIATVTLNHPEACNALSGKMIVELSDAVNDLTQWSTGKAVIVAATENRRNIFCSGGDLQIVKKLNSHQQGYKFSIFMTDVLSRLSNLPLVSVAAMDGAALGGGAELVTSTDFRIVTQRSSVAFVQTKMGLVTGFGGGRRLTDLLGYHTALRLLLTAKEVRAEEGRAMGYFDHILPGTHSPQEEAKEWLKLLIDSVEPEVIHALKPILRPSSHLLPDELSQRLDFDSRTFASLWSGEANRKALQANIKHK